MAEVIKVIGAEEIKQKMKDVGVELGSTFRRGLIKAGLFTERESKKEVPIHLGPLRASGGSRANGLGWDTDVVVFYNEPYAVYVHENETALHGLDFNILYAEEIANASTPAQEGYWFNRGENQKAKFLEDPVRENKDKILRIIANEAEKIS